MYAQTEAYLLQLESARQEVPGLVSGLSATQFNWRSTPDVWSIAQCLEHLNLTVERYLPVLRSALAEARARGLESEGPFALGFFERLFLTQALEPPPRWRVKTRPAFVAPDDIDLATVVQRFDELRTALAQVIRDADGLDWRGVKVRSQFGPISWTLNGTFAFILAHERRHLWQARELRRRRDFPAV